MTNINEIDNDLDFLIEDIVQDNKDIQQKKAQEYKSDFLEKKKIFNEWIGEYFDKAKTGEYVEKLLSEPKYGKIQSFYKNIKKNIKENIKLLGYVLEEKGLADFKSELWESLPNTTIIGIKKGKEVEVANFLLEDSIIKNFIEENKRYNQEELLNISLRVPDFYKKLFQLIDNKQLSNSFFEKDDSNVDKLLNKVGINYEEFEVEYSNKWSSIYLSLLKQIYTLSINFKKINGILQYILNYKVLPSSDKQYIKELAEKTKKLIKKMDELSKIEEFNYYINWLFNPDFDKWFINSEYKSIGTLSLTKTFTTKIWNIFKSYLSELDEINSLITDKNFKDLLGGIENYIFTNNGVFQNFLDLTNYKTNIKQMLLSGYSYQGDKLINEDDLKKLTNNVLLDRYSISNEYNNLTLGLDFITDDKYNFVKEYNYQDELLPQRLIQKADSLIKTNYLIKDIDNNVINYLKTFFFEYIRYIDEDELYTNPGVERILDEKKVLPVWLYKDLEKRIGNLKKHIININKDIFYDKITKKYIYIIETKTGTFKLSIVFKKDILLEYKKDITIEDIILVRENLLYYINNNFPNLIDIFKDNNLLLSNFIKTKLDNIYFYNSDYNLSGFIDYNQNTLNKIKYFYETSFGYIIDNIIEFIKTRTSIKDYIIMSLIVNDLIYVYTKKVI